MRVLRNRLNVPKTRDEGEVEVELILEPLDGSGGLVGQDLDEVGTGLVTGGLEGIIVKLLDAVGNADLNLCPCKGTVDTGGSLGRVSTKEACSVGNICQRRSHAAGLSPSASMRPESQSSEIHVKATYPACQGQ